MIEQGLFGGVVALVVLGFFFGLVRRRHMGSAVAATHIGAVIYALLFGALVGFVILPVRLSLMEGEASAEEWAFWRHYLPAMGAFLLLVRSDLLMRLPGVGKFLRAYRAAGLRRAVENAEKRLAKFTAMGG